MGTDTAHRPGGPGASMIDRFRQLWDSLLPVGRDPAGAGWNRYAWAKADLAARDWFAEQARVRGLALDADGNGNLFAWRGDPAAGDAVLTGSHLDSVPHGGGYDGALGVVSGLLALDLLADRGVALRRPVGVAVFAEEEGARFGAACLGSRLLTGAADPDQARALTDRDSVPLSEAMVRAGMDPAGLGPDPRRLARIGAFVELHIEQGRGLAALAAPVGVGSGVWPHGRWRMELAGRGDHAGTTAMADRHDPTLTAAFAVLAANKEARLRGARATVGRVEPVPNATNTIPERVSLWLDARAPEQETLDGLVAAVRAKVADRAGRDGTTVSLTPESASPAVTFDPGLRERLRSVLGGVPELPTAAGHDAGILAAAGVPAAMLFVRNPTGVSHAPGETATDADCAAGVVALADVLVDLACRPEIRQ